MGFVAHDAVHNHGAGFLQDAGEINVFFFVEASTQFNNHGHLCAEASCFGERLHQFRRFVCAVKRLFYRQDRGVFRCLSNPIDNRQERFIGVQKQLVFACDGGENRLMLLQYFRQAWCKFREAQVWPVYHAKKRHQSL